MPQHISQKTALAQKSKIGELEAAIDQFFDQYNLIRNGVYAALNLESEIIKSVTQGFEKDLTQAQKTKFKRAKNKIELDYPEYIQMRDYQMLYAGKKELLKELTNKIEKLLIPKKDES